MRTKKKKRLQGQLMEKKEKNKMSKQKKHEDWFRSNVARGIKDGKSGVDREKGIIYGFAVITKGVLYFLTNLAFSIIFMKTRSLVFL